MTPGLYERALEALFGRWYVDAAADALSFNRKQIQRQVGGVNGITDDTIDNIIALMIAKRAQDNLTLQELRREREARADSVRRGRNPKRPPKGRQEGDSAP